MPGITKVQNSQKLKLIQKVKPNFIYNRFDIRYENDFDLYKVVEGKKNIYVPVHIEDKTAQLGLWLTEISEKSFISLKKKIFDDYKDVDIIQAQHSLNKVRKKSKKSIHWHMDLKTNIEDFNAKLSKKARYNTKWYPKKIIEDFSKYDVKHYKVSEISANVMKTYFEFKGETHSGGYNMNSEEYLKNYYVTDAYVLRISDEIAAIAFSNITDQNIYLENITYNQKFRKYSVGTILYYHIIKEMVSEKYNTMFLCSGTSEYKNRFNGVATPTYSGKVMRRSAYIKKFPIKLLNLVKKPFKK